jgi:hypothetical protein
MPELPIACTLSPDGMTARLALTDALAADGLLDRTPTVSGPRVRLRDTPDKPIRVWKDAHVAITGGTGAYQGARGSVVSVSSTTDGSSQDTITLLP